MSFNHWTYSIIYQIVATYSSKKHVFTSAIWLTFRASGNSDTIEGVQLMSVNSSSLINRRQYRGKNGKKSKMGGQISCVGGVILLFSFL
jgi:hypothetical protein